MSGHLCLKWNNHSTAFIKSISAIQLKEKYCDATIVCQGKYFPVHRIILSTCSDYFNEIFDRIQCQHPYIVFKDIEPREMELLLNYMYIGEVNVAQELLPTLIKAAEALKIKGLAVPDDLPNSETSSKKRRNNTDTGSPFPKRKSDERRVRRRSSSGSNTTNFDNSGSTLQKEGKTIIKEEPLDTSDLVEIPFGTTDGEGDADAALKSDLGEKEGTFTELNQFTDAENPLANFIKTEVGQELGDQQPFGNQSDAWSEFGGASSALPDLPPADDANQDDITESERRSSYGNMPRIARTRGIVRQASFDEGRRNITKASLEEPINTLRQASFAESGAVRKASLEDPAFSQYTEGEYYKCSYCNYQSRTKSHIKIHEMYKHTGERPFACTFCSRRFTQKCDLRKHMIIHTGERPYLCSFCGRGFTQSSSRRTHERKCRSP